MNGHWVFGDYDGDFQVADDLKIIWNSDELSSRITMFGLEII